MAFTSEGAGGAAIVSGLSTTNGDLSVSGRIGVGTSTPASILHLVSGTTDNPMITLDHESTSNVSQGGTVNFVKRDTDGAVLADNIVLGDIGFRGVEAGGTERSGAMIRGRTQGVWADGGNCGTELAFYTAQTTGSGTHQRMCIQKDGKVGIGITSPEAYLHVNQDTDLGTSVGDQQMFLKLSGDSANNDQLEMSQIRTSTLSDADDWYSSQWRIQRKVDSTYMGWIGFGGEEGSGDNNFGISFGIGHASHTSPLDADEAMRIEGSNGFVGIGTTTPEELLHVAGNIKTTGYIIEGRTVIKVPATAFVANDDEVGVTHFSAALEDDGSNFGMRSTKAPLELYAYIDVPLGYTATKVRINGSNDDVDIYVYTLDLDDGTVSTAIQPGTTSTSLETNDDTALATNGGSNHVGADDKMLLIKVVTTATDDIIYGGYVTIQAT